MTRDELRDAAAQMLGFPSYAQSRPEQSWIARAVTRAVYKAFQPEDDTRTRWAERTFGLHLPGAITASIGVTQGGIGFTHSDDIPASTFAGSYVVIGNTFYTFKERTDDSNGEFIEPYEGETGTVSATFYHNSITLDPSVFSVMASPELLGYGQLSEITGKRQEILARGLVYNDYWPEDGAFYYNSLAIQKGATNSLLIGTPNFYFVDDTALGDSYARRFVVHPLPQVKHSIKYRASVAPTIPATGDVPFPGPADFADVVLIPILEKICSSSKRYDGKNQRELATEYASALSTLRRFSRNQKRRPSRLRVRPGY